MLHAYVELVRPSNVVTAVGDVLAGYAIAGMGNHFALPWLIVASAALYAGGIALNDYFDRDVDAEERPERPIPSGRVSAAGAAMLGGGLLSAGALSAYAASLEGGILATLIAALVVGYDAWGKHHPVVGPVAMGLCRALNLMLGVAAVPSALADAWHVALLPFLYIASLTMLSRGEVHGGERGAAAFALISLSFVVLALVTMALMGAPPSMVGIVLVLVLAWRVGRPLWAAFSAPRAETIRTAVRAGILSLVLIDTVIGAAYGGPLYAAVILMTAVIAGRLAQKFAVT